MSRINPPPRPPQVKESSLQVYLNQLYTFLYLLWDQSRGTVSAQNSDDVELTGGEITGLTVFGTDYTITWPGITATQTINKPSGSVNFPASGASLTLNNSLITTTSRVIATVATNDLTLKSVAVVVGSGSAVLHGNSPATAEAKVFFLVIN